MTAHITSMLMFEGKAEEAMRCYVTLFDERAVTRLDKFGPGESVSWQLNLP